MAKKTKSSSKVSNQPKEIDMNVPAMEVIGFTKRYKGAKKPAVSNASFKVMPGEFHGFIGANGAGKTTTIKSLIGAYAQFEGTVKMFGFDNSTLEAKERIGYIPESANFPKGLPAIKYITYMSFMSGLSLKDSEKFAAETLEEIGLGPLKNRDPNTFSSGQKKKVLLAQALVHNPDIIIMDEPAANLDPQARIEFFDSLRQLQKKGKAIFISSHILTELDKYVDSITIVDGGKVAYSGKVKDVIENPELEYYTESEEKDKDELEKLLVKIGAKPTNFGEGFSMKLHDMKTVKKVMKALADSKIEIKTFKNNQRSLEEVYTHFVQLGSVDTEGKDIKTRRDQTNAKELENKENDSKEAKSKKAAKKDKKAAKEETPSKEEQADKKEEAPKETEATSKSKEETPSKEKAPAKKATAKKPAAKKAPAKKPAAKKDSKEKGGK